MTIRLNPTWLPGLALLLFSTSPAAGQPATPAPRAAVTEAAGAEGAEAMQRSFEREAAGQLAEALSALESVPASRSSSYVVLARRAWLLNRLGRADAAVEAYQRAIATAPAAVEARLGLMLPLMTLRRFSELVVAAKAVLAIEPRSYLATLRLAFAHYSLGHFAEAGALYAQLKTAYPSDLDVRSGLGWSLLKQGKSADAGREFRELLAISPRHTLGKQGLDAVLAHP